MDRTIVFVNSLFPCLSETFVYDQFVALRRAGLKFVVVSNHRPAEDQVHPRMRPMQQEVLYLCEAGLFEIAAAHLYVAFRHPLRYLGTLIRIPFAEERLRVTVAQVTGAALIVRRFGGLPGMRLHAHFTYGAAGVVMWAHRLAGTAYGLTLHGSDLLYDFPADLAAKLGEADAIVSISKYNLTFLDQRFPTVRPKHLAVIPLGVPPRPAAPRQTRGEYLKILNVGRLSDHKAQHYLIEACALLAERGISFRCDIVGEGPKRDFLESRIREFGLADKVRLLGPRYHDEVLALYAGYDVFVLCSITEGMPVVIMEAMRAGIPVVASAISGIPELVQDGGCLVPPGEPEALAKVIEDIGAGRVDILEMTARAQSIIARDFDLDGNHRRFQQFLESAP
jgi:glycosyltransferase involved in cell wall biosynthesis